MVSIQASKSEGKDWDHTDSHASDYNFDDMCRLINKILTEVPSATAKPFPDTMQDQFRKLFLRLADPNGIVFLTKGIHQPTKLHFNIYCNTIGEFHVYLSQGAGQLVKTKPAKINPITKKYGTAGLRYAVQLFEYNITGVTYKYGASQEDFYKWPALFVIDGYPNRQRRLSLSSSLKTATQARPPNADELKIISANPQNFGP